MYARNTKIPIDTLDFSTKALTITPEDVVQPPEQVRVKPPTPPPPPPQL
jgi:hypothetical protein